MPLPVLAAPRMSRPFNASGIAFDWISVSVEKCVAFKPSVVGAESGRSESDGVEGGEERASQNEAGE